MIEKTIRAIVMQRDNLNAVDVDAMFEDACEQLADGAEPEEVLADVFGLEPDYLYDHEFWECVTINYGV